MNLIESIDYLREISGENNGNQGSVTLSFPPLTSPFSSLNNSAIIQLNNPAKRNSLSSKMILEFNNSINLLLNILDKKENHLYSLIVIGTGSTFCSGFDLDTTTQGNLSKIGNAMSLVMSDTLDKLSKLPLITISAIQGIAMGGGAEITTATDYRLMSSHSFIRFVHLRMGLTCAWGGAKRLLSLVRKQDALRIMATCQKLSPNDALDIGYCDYIIPNNQDFIDGIAKFLKPFIFQDDEKLNPIKPLRAIKHLIVTNAKDEHDEFMKLWGGPDNLEALSARRRHH